MLVAVLFAGLLNKNTMTKNQLIEIIRSKRNAYQIWANIIDDKYSTKKEREAGKEFRAIAKELTSIIKLTLKK